MKQAKYFALMFAGMLGTLFTSCEETAEFDEYADWKARNIEFVDSIAKVAKANPDQWRVIHTFKFDPPLNDLNPDVNDYVYCKILENGKGTMKPYFTDSVGTHYRGRLIPLYDGSKVVFDESYQGELNADVAEQVVFSVDGVVEGWQVALQEMVEGDRWEVYIPHKMGYGAYGNSSIPGYSTLIFDMQLVKIYTNR